MRDLRILLFRGAVTIYLEPRDIWVGAFVSIHSVYVCPLPCLVIKFDRDWSWRRMDWKV
jgi:hypothetical protein